MKKNYLKLKTPLVLFALLFGSQLLTAQGTITQTSFIGQPSFDVTVGGNYLYLQPTSSQIVPYNLNFPEVPASEPAAVYTGNTNSFIEYVDGFIYGAGGIGNTFRVFDLATANNPTVIGSTNIQASNVRCVAGNSDYAYLGSSDSLFVVDVTNKNSPSNTVSFSDANLSGGSVVDLLVHGSVLYVANTSGLLVYDLMVPGNPSYVTTVSGITNCTGLAIDPANSRLFSGKTAGFDVLDISNPSAPSVVGSASGGGGNSTLQFGGGFVLQEGVDNSSSQGVAGYIADSNSPSYMDNLLGTIGFSITGMANVDSIFYVCKFGGVEVMKLERIVGLEEGPSVDFEWFPNPASGQARLRLPEAMTEAQATLYSPMGHVVRDMQMGQNEMTVDLTGLAAGTYFVEVRSEGFAPTRRLVIVQ